MLNHIEHTVLGTQIDQSLRSEAVQFSDSGKNIALVDSGGQILYFDVDTSTQPIKVTLQAVYKSDVFKRPHAVGFLSDQVIVVANRLGLIEFFRIPDQNLQLHNQSLDNIYTLDADWFGAPGHTKMCGDRPIATGPGALDYRNGLLYVGCNLENTISVHTCSLINDTVEVADSYVISMNLVDIPDAVSVSADGQWLAISDHQNRRVVILETVTGETIGTLQTPELKHPHGIRFDNSGKQLVVSDAGGQKLHLFQTDVNWSSGSSIAYSILDGIDDDAFNKTLSVVPAAYQSLEGGIKGIGYDPISELYITTCRNQLLRFYSLSHSS